MAVLPLTFLATQALPMPSLLALNLPNFPQPEQLRGGGATEERNVHDR